MNEVILSVAKDLVKIAIVGGLLIGGLIGTIISLFLVWVA